MPQISYFKSSHGVYSVGIQPEFYTPVYYYPAIVIATETELAIYPAVDSFSELDAILKLGLFKPPSVEQKMALNRYNTSHYRPSKAVEKLITPIPNVPALEMMVKEMSEMEEIGVAFK
jgi:hypothetical protein